MAENRARRKLEAGGVVKSISIAFCHPGMVEYLGHLGFDVIALDTVTQSVTVADVEDFARACDVGGVTPMVACRPEAPLTHYASAGILGFNLKNVESLAEVRAVIDAVKFPPEGKRVTGTWRSNGFGILSEDWPAYMERANANISIQVTVEDVAGLALIPEIVKIPAVTALHIAFHDLTFDMGLSGQKRHPKVIEAFEKARATILGAGKANSMSHLIDTPPEIVDEYKRGTRIFCTSDRRALAEGTTEFVRTVNALQ